MCLPPSNVEIFRVFIISSILFLLTYFSGIEKKFEQLWRTEYSAVYSSNIRAALISGK
jgi:hypothetical protein